MAEETNQQSDYPVQPPLPADGLADDSVSPSSAEMGDAGGGNEAIAPVAVPADSFSLEAVSPDEPVEEIKLVEETIATEAPVEAVPLEVPIPREETEAIEKTPVETAKEIIKEIPVERIVIKEIPVEKIIEKIIIKEVPIEIIKEVVREVPVEKIVVKEVIKEVPVIKEIIKEAPIINQAEIQKQVEEKLKERQMDNGILGNRKRKEKRENNLNKILEKNKENGRIGNQDVRNLLRVSKRTAIYYLKELAGRGLLKKEKKGRSMIYKA